MSDVNKLDNKQCPFDLSKYKSNDVVAPVGSVPWAIIQVYEGKAVGRTEWNSLAEYIHLSTKNDGSGPIHIEKHNKDGISEVWEPTLEDLMACDWNLLKSKQKPDDCMLGFDLTIGTGTYSYPDHEYGYLADNEFELGTAHQGPFGTLTNPQNKTDITKFSFFTWSSGGQILRIRVSSDNNHEGYQKMVELFKKTLTIIADGVPYPLGEATEINTDGEGEYEFAGQYNNTEAQKLGALLKQNVGNTLHFCFNWK
ncbi:conserved hypothetical protein [Xenorhabdus bovienii str. oregonense]|uniref:DUF2829 domain-containing protein n=1 Tax=Xenorhabdus bovienii str. oregonense TaxID=1398202 RepID=A0A077P9T5_XENBV|nr:MW1434 family type I TA system toxin [Xenorhabdus bovienii]CDH07604.1 conserved hypothetical protein [Xenorhabdus bovienii str. oregonense]